MGAERRRSVELIPVDRIAVLNPRVRNRRIFKEITHNIAELGLKKPITVRQRETSDGPSYDLVCGQGRLEAYQALGQREIPAFVIEADTEDCLIMSLVENLARRQHRAIDLLHDIEGLRKRGYSESAIARKTDLSLEYVRGVLRLLSQGEHRLLRAVESGQIPVSVAVDIAESDDEGIQRALQSAYESKLLRGQKLLAAKRLIEQRRNKGKGRQVSRGPWRKRDRDVSSSAIVRAYREDVDRKLLLIRKANATRDRLIFVIEALRKLLSDERFVLLLRAESLDTIPQNMADRIRTGGQF
jgi:ParB family transcriptional regulator, chromosome partitioning protein